MPSLLWMAPALSGGGYSSEALAFGLGLVGQSGLDYALRQFAVQPDAEFYEGLPPSIEGMLRAHYEPPNAEPVRDGVVVCHSTPDAWVPSKFPGWDAVAPCPDSHESLGIQGAN